MAGHKIPCIKYGNNIIILFDGEVISESEN